MRQLSFAEITRASLPDKKCISLYVPSAKHYPNSRERETNLKSLVNEVQSISAKSGSFPKDVFLHKLQTDLPKIADLQEKHGVAWFCSESLSGWLPVRSIEESLAVVSDSFHLKPIFRDMQSSKPFYVLAVSLDVVKLFVRTGDSLTLMDWEDVKIEFESDSGSDDRARHKKIKTKARQRQLNACIQLIGRHMNFLTYPLVIAGVKTVSQEIARKLYYPFTQKQIYACNVRSISREELFSGTKKIADNFFEAEENQILEEVRYCEKAGKAVTEIEEIAKVALAGQVEAIVIPEDLKIWGEIDWNSGKLTIHEKQKSVRDDDLLDDIAEIVFSHGGKVLVVPREKLADAHLVASLRW